MNILIVEDEAPAARRLRRLVAAELAIEADDILLADSLDAARKNPGTKSSRSVAARPRPGRARRFRNAARGARSETGNDRGIGHVDRALEAFDREVVDFVSKPVVTRRLARALRRVREGRKDESRLAIRALGRTEIVATTEIVHIAGADDYVEITTVDGRKLLHSDKLDQLEKRLPLQFLRSHRSHIVNLQLVARLEGDAHSSVLVTRDGCRIPVSRRRIAKVKRALLSV